jgi:two-component system, OmpR family, response regulator VicR
MRILVIEDEIMVLKSIEFKLKKEGFEVITALDGKIALDLLNEEKFDFVITDLMIPYYGGLELINHIRTELKSKVPIIVLSSIGQEVSILEAFKLGANDYMTKPFIPNELIIRIRKESIR